MKRGKEMIKKTILITGSTDGIGLETAKTLVSNGHHILLHGRNLNKLRRVEKSLSSLPKNRLIKPYLADLSKLETVENLAGQITNQHTKLDVLINNAGVFKTPHPITKNGIDIRFIVNTIAPFLLTKRLLPLMNTSSRIINLSSAAQSSLNLKALQGEIQLTDMEAYAQSKLAIIMWSYYLAHLEKENMPVIISVNPGSMLGSKMVKEGFGVTGGDIRIGAKILTSLALEDEFKTASGKYFDNDLGQFNSPHPDALNLEKCTKAVTIIQKLIDKQ